VKILQVVHKPQRRGAEVFTRQLSEQLRMRGHQVRTAYLYSYRGANPLPLGRDDVELDGREYHVFEKIPGIHPFLLSRLRKVVEETRPDVVQVNGGRTVKYGAAIAAQCRKRRWVLIYRNIGQPGNWAQGARHAFYSRFVLPRIDGMVSVSTRTLQEIDNQYHLPVPTVCIPSAVDPNAITSTVSRGAIRRQTGTPDDAAVLVWVGSLTPEKRPDRLLRVASRVRQRVPNLHVWVIGDGPLRRSLESDARALSLGDSVHFLGVKMQVANYINAGDVVTLTSDTEGMPAVLLEAGLLARPAVATHVGGVAECVLHGRTGILVPRTDEERFANAVQDLLQQPAWQSRLAAAAKVWVERHFTIDLIAERYAAFYQQVMAG
jgi:glycosyltransferase involved in cell wall biosynthesis